MCKHDVISINRYYVFPRLRSEKMTPAGQQRHRTSDGTCYRLQYSVISWSYPCGSGFPAAIKRIYSDFLSWLESHSHEQLVLSYGYWVSVFSTSTP